jgi:transketolase C-terminal domain/subunit
MSRHKLQIKIAFTASELAALVRSITNYEVLESSDSRTVRRVVDRIKKARRQWIIDEARQNEQQAAAEPENMPT